MRVTHTITKGDVGGAQTYVVELAIAQSVAGHDVHVVTGLDGPAMGRVRAAGIGVTIVPELRRTPGFLGDRVAVRRLRSIYRETGTEIVHGHSSKGGLLSRVAARQEGIASVYTAHGFPFQPGAPPVQRLLSYVGELVGGRLGSAVICLTENEARLARRARLTRPERIHVVGNGLPDTPHRRTAGVGSRAVRFMMVARFSPPKLQVELIEAFSELGPGKWSLTFVGDGEGLPDAEQRGRELLGARVDFVGHRDDVERLIAEHDVAILWSGYEGMPIALMEAMRAGLACIGSDLPGVRALLSGNGGIVASSRSELVETVRRLIADPSAVDVLGQAARARFEAEFLIDDMVRRIDDVYRSVM